MGVFLGGSFFEWCVLELRLLCYAGRAMHGTGYPGQLWSGAKQS